MTKADTTPRARVALLVSELDDAKRKRARAFSAMRMRGREITVEDARWGSLEMMADGAAAYRARDPEIVRIELALALHDSGIEYPAGGD